MIRTPFYIITVNGEKLKDDIYRKIEKVVFKEPQDAEEFFTISMVDNDLTIIDSSAFIEDKTIVTLAMGYTDDFGYMMDGIVSNIKPDFPKSGDPKLDITVKSVANVMDRVDRFAKYNGKTYSEIAKAIAKRYGLRVIVTNTKSFYNPKLKDGDGLIQSGLSDWMFLKQIASKLNYNCFIRDGVLHFVEQKKELISSGVLLEYRVGQANLLSFQPNLSTTGKSNSVALNNINITDKSIIGYDTVIASEVKTVVNNAPKKVTQRTHIVKKGEYVIMIAKQYGVDWRKILELNPSIKAPKYVIYPNQKIIIP